jgi:hypothetical protein
VDHQRQQDHRNADDPYHLRSAHEPVVEIKENEEPYNGELQDNQP